MDEFEDFDILEIETSDAAFIYDEFKCVEEREIDEYGDYGITANHYYKSCYGCLILFSSGFLLAVTGIMMLVLAL